jgi:hypothetical protein
MMNGHPFIPRGNFFDDPDRVARLRAEIDSWLGTPFHADSQAKGRTGGVDCIRLCEAIMIACGVVEPFEFPRVPMDFTQHQERSIVLEFLEGHYPDPQSTRLAQRFAVVDPGEPRLPGDLYTFEIGQAVNHIGIAYDETRFIHCFTKVGTVLANITDPTFAERLHTIFRARATPLTADL